MNIEDIKKSFNGICVSADIWHPDDMESVNELIFKLEQAKKALQYYDTLYANIESNIEHGELITDWLRKQGETARTALKSIQGDE